MDGAIVPEHRLKSLCVICVTHRDRRDLRVPIEVNLNDNIFFICSEPV